MKSDLDERQQFMGHPNHQREQTELEKAQLDRFWKEFEPPSMEEVFAQVDRETTTDQIIMELEGWAAKSAL